MHYNNNTLAGTCTKFYSDGKKRLIMKFGADDLKTGKTYYFKNGAVQSNRKY